MKATKVTVAVVLFTVVTGCEPNRGVNEAGNRPSAPVSTTVLPGQIETTSNTTVDATTQSSDGSEMFDPGINPEVVFVGPLETYAGELAVRFAPNSWYQESDLASLPFVGDLQWFLDTEAGCLVVDRSTFLDAVGLGHEITITPGPSGWISIGESRPLYVEGDWLIHNGCAEGDPLIHSEQ